MKLLAIDPGFNTGFAYWENGLQYPDETGQFVVQRDDPSLEAKVSDCHLKFKQLIWRLHKHTPRVTERVRPELVLLEGVQLWGASAKSQTAGTKGDLMGLAYLVGGYAQICFDYGIKYKVIDPTAWKGQMGDKVITARIERAIQMKYRTEHIRSAVGLGLEYMGLL